MEFEIKQPESIRYDPETRKVRNARNKAVKFVELNLLEETEPGVFKCLPLPGNTLEYKIKLVGRYENERSDFHGKHRYDCNCQRYTQIKQLDAIDNAICSHIQAVYIWSRKNGRETQ